MPHPADFIDAHHRHWADAELLFDHDRWANADHLYGFSAECGLKAVMQGCGMRVDPTTGIPDEPRHRKHVQKIWPIFRSFVETREDSEYLDRLPPGEPFADWSHTTATRTAATAAGPTLRRIGAPPARFARSSRRRGRMVCYEGLRLVR